MRNERKQGVGISRRIKRAHLQPQRPRTLYVQASCSSLGRLPTLLTQPIPFFTARQSLHRDVNGSVDAKTQVVRCGLLHFKFYLVFHKAQREKVVENDGRRNALRDIHLPCRHGNDLLVMVSSLQLMWYRI